MLSSLAILLLNPTLFQVYKPKYRYVDAIAIIQEEENIILATNSEELGINVVHYGLPYQQYLMTGTKHEQMVQFVFDPYTGKYYFLNPMMGD